MTDAALERRIAEIVGAVARQALADRGRTHVAVVDDGSPEAALAIRLLAGQLGGNRVGRVTADTPLVDEVAQEVGTDRERAEEEVQRMLARLLDDALPAHPANKTALLLGGELPPEPLLPLGDLWATDVVALQGGWSAPGEVEMLAEAAGGIDALDGALRRLIDGRDPAALDGLDPDVAARVRSMLAAGSASRRHPRIVPKLGARTLCADLYE
ncbi:MAG TPA: hypothetical protein VFR37_13695 [Longimicrobium sp.]|nr:hypothetical protein [Longimicrobium sp.]